MNKSKSQKNRKAARTCKNKSAHFTGADAIAARDRGQSKPAALKKLTLEIPENILLIMAACAASQGKTVEGNITEWLVSGLECDAECFSHNVAVDIKAWVEGRAK